MAAFRTSFWWIALALALIFTISAPGLISRAVLDGTALQESKDSKDRLHGWTRKQMKILLDGLKAKPHSEWTGADKQAYDAMRQALQDCGEQWPGTPESAVANRR